MRNGNSYIRDSSHFVEKTNDIRMEELVLYSKNSWKYKVECF